MLHNELPFRVCSLCCWPLLFLPNIIFVNLGRRHSELYILRKKLSLAKDQVEAKEREEEEEEEVRKMLGSRTREE